MKKQFLLFMMLLFMGVISGYSTVGLKIQAEGPNARSNSGDPRDVDDSSLSGSQKLAYIWDSYWVRYDDVTFDGSEEKITVSVVAYGAGGDIEFRLGSTTGTLIGTATVSGTGIVETSMVSTSGTYDLYLVFKNSSSSSWLYDLDYFSFGILGGSSSVKTEAENYDDNSGAKVANGNAVGYIKNGTWVKYNQMAFNGTETDIDVNNVYNGDGGSIEYRLDAVDGTLIGTATISGLGLANTTISTTTGLHDLYLVFVNESSGGYLFDVDYFTINGELPTYTFSTDVSPASSGSVSQSPEGSSFDQGTSITVTATKTLGYEFDHWENGSAENVSSDNPYTFSITENTTLTAIFNSVSTYELTNNLSNSSVSFSPEPTDVDGANMYNTGEEITITATPDFGYQFVNWVNESDVEQSTNQSYTFTISGNTTLDPIVSEIAAYALPSWSFNKEFLQKSGDGVTYHIPTLDDGTSSISGSDAWIYPNNATKGDSVGMTAVVSSLSSNLVGSNYCCRILWSGTNSVSDFTDASQHNQYYQFKFSTIGFTGIGVDFTFSGGQNDADDYLELVYSVDGGTTWVDGGNYNAENHWNSWPNYTPSLTNADNKNLVIVRLIGITTSTGSSNNFNLDQFTVTSTSTTTTWDGETNTDWATASNWNNGIPAADINVVIPSGLSNFPSVTEATTINNLTIESDATLIGAENITVNGTTTVKRTLDTGSWQYISSPVTGATANDIKITTEGQAAYMMKYDNSVSGAGSDLSLGWSYITSNTAPLTPGVGYAVWVTEAKTVEFTGTLATGNQTISSVATNENAWKLIGNSALAHIDWSGVASDNDITGSAYVYKPTLNGGAGGYGTIGADGIAVNAESDYIPPMQGFFIEVDAAVDGDEDNSFSLPTSALSHSSQGFYKSSNLKQNFIRLAVQNATCNDEAIFYFKEDAANGYHSKTDAHKLLLEESEVPQLYSLAGKDKLVINTLSEWPVSIPLEIQATVAENVTLKVLELENLDAGLNVFLEDKTTGQFIDLTQNDSYEAFISEGANDNRFVLHYTSSVLKANTLNTTLIAYSFGNNLVVNKTEKGRANVSVFNLDGKNLTNYQISGNHSVISTSLKEGIYLVKVNTKNAQFIKRVAIK